MQRVQDERRERENYILSTMEKHMGYVLLYIYIYIYIEEAVSSYFF
jgi:hypothetical protein